MGVKHERVVLEISENLGVCPALLPVLVETSSTALCEEENVTAGELWTADGAGPTALSPSCHLTGSSA